MKRVKSRAADGVRAEYDFRGAVRGKYFERFRRGSNLVLLEPDVFAAFPTSEAVNQALRSLVSAARKSSHVIRRAPSPRRRPSKRVGRTVPLKVKRRGAR